VVDAAIYESVLNMMESLVTEYDQLGHVRERSGTHSAAHRAFERVPHPGRIVMIGANQTRCSRGCARPCRSRRWPGSALPRSPGSRHEPAGAGRGDRAWTATLDTRISGPARETRRASGLIIAPPTCCPLRTSRRARPS
jgi:crotonobetainyl-CoA:carnitine CoA-transferase CaiB-like acyl-CoA transferase